MYHSVFTTKDSCKIWFQDMDVIKNVSYVRMFINMCQVIRLKNTNGSRVGREILYIE